MASTDTPKTVLLRGDPTSEERIAGGAITPGHLVQRTSSNTVTVHGAASAKTAKLVAREMELTGKGIDDAYAADDQALYWNAKQGDQFYMWLAAGETISIGDLLESAGDGTLQAVTTGGEPLFEAVEAVTTTSVAARIKVEAL